MSENDYFSIEAILAENQKLPLTFKTLIPEMGHLGGGSERDITPNSKLQIPIWLVYIMIYSDWAGMSKYPPPFSIRVRNALDAEPRSVKLSSLVGAGGWWYGLGKTVMDIVDPDDGALLSQLLTKTFQDRVVEVIDQAQHFAALGPVGGAADSGGDAAQGFREGLDNTERELFGLAQESARKTKWWYEDSVGGKR